MKNEGVNVIIEKTIKTFNKEELIEVTSLIKEEVKKNNMRNGLLTVFIPHTTAAVTINENADKDVRLDLVKSFNSFDFEKLDFRHIEGNSAAHTKSSLVGTDIQLIIHEGKIMLGTWQGIFFCEFDGPRNRKFLMKFITG